MKKKTVMIVGSGVLGSYLSKIFLKEKNTIYVTTRNYKKSYKNYKYHKIEKKVNFIRLDVLDKLDIKKKIKLINPDIIYYFAGQSSISQSYNKKSDTMKSNFNGALNFLKILYQQDSKIKFFKASSGYIFNSFTNVNNKKTSFVKPYNPYVESQIKAFKSIKKFRRLGLNCSSLIFFNIESPLKPKSFLLNKVKYFLKLKKLKFLKLGNIDVIRDFSWAAEIMQGVYYASALKPQDIIFRSGKNFLIRDMIKYFFKLKKLNYRNYIKIDKKLYRKNEKIQLFNFKSNANTLLKKWNWRPKIYGESLILKLYNSID